MRPSFGAAFCFSGIFFRCKLSNLTPHIEFDENNIPINLDFGDSYYSKSGGLDETLEVFIKACNLYEKFANQKNIIIGETGFGTGLNFLVVWQEWQKNRKPNSILHFYTFEKFLMPKETAQKALSKWPQLNNDAQKLLSKWPIATSGLQRIWLDEQTSLNIIIGDANETMQKQNFKADAWFLDGFAPRSNPDFWNDNIFSQVARLIKTDGRVATYSVAKIVRDGLEAAGFEHKKCEGFGSKRERLEAWPKSSNIQELPKLPAKIAIIGGGISGSALYYALKKRGADIEIFDNDIKGEHKASNNPRGLIMPRIDRQDTVEARLFKLAYLYAIRELEAFEKNGFDKTIIKEFAKSKRDIEKYKIFKLQNPIDDELLQIEDDYLIHKGAMAYPSKLCENLRGKNSIIEADIKSIKFDGEKWHLFDAQNVEYVADIVILANGHGINRFLFDTLPITGRMGQVSITKQKYCDDNIPRAASGYSVPFEDGFLFGATFEVCELSKIPQVTSDANLENIKVLSEFLPDLANNIDENELEARASMRVVSDDMRPIAGAIYNENNLFTLGALGSRGFSLALILAELIACEIYYEPSPFEDEIRNLVTPHRFFKAK